MAKKLILQRRFFVIQINQNKIVLARLLIGAYADQSQPLRVEPIGLAKNIYAEFFYGRFIAYLNHQNIALIYWRIATQYLKLNTDCFGSVQKESRQNGKNNSKNRYSNFQGAASLLLVA